MTIRLEQLMGLMQSSDASPDEIREQLEAWDIDPLDWLKWAQAITEESAKENGLTPFNLLLQFWMGFELGFRLSMEIEMQRIANGG